MVACQMTVMELWLCIMMATIHSKIEEYLGRTPDWNDEVLVSKYS